MIGHINISHIRNKFEVLSNSIRGNLDSNTNLLMLSKTKISPTFPTNQFCYWGICLSMWPLHVPLHVASPITFDRNVRRGRTLLYIREDISARLLTISLPKHFERFFIKLNLCEKKIFRCCSLNSAKCNVSSRIFGRTVNKHMPSNEIFELLETLI